MTKIDGVIDKKPDFIFDSLLTTAVCTHNKNTVVEIFDHSVFVVSENCCSQRGVKNKVWFFVYNSVNFGPTDKI